MADSIGERKRKEIHAVISFFFLFLIVGGELAAVRKHEIYDLPPFLFSRPTIKGEKRKESVRLKRWPWWPSQRLALTSGHLRVSSWGRIRSRCHSFFQPLAWAPIIIRKEKCPGWLKRNEWYQRDHLLTLRSMASFLLSSLSLEKRIMPSICQEIFHFLKKWKEKRRCQTKRNKKLQNFSLWKSNFISFLFDNNLLFSHFLLKEERN